MLFQKLSQCIRVSTPKRRSTAVVTSSYTRARADSLMTTQQRNTVCKRGARAVVIGALVNGA